MKLYIYWLENVINFMGPSQKNTLPRVSVLKPNALHSCYFILRVPCSLQLFGRTRMTTILFQGQFRHLFYQVRVKNNIFLIFQPTFVQDSQMLLLPQVHTIVKLFLDMTLCVELLQIIATCANTVKEWPHQTLQPLVWIYSARIILMFFIPLTAVRWLKMYAHLSSISNGISSSHLPVTWENILVQNQFVNG